MKRIIIRLTTICGFVMCAIVAARGVHAGLSLEISSHKDVYLVWEPLYVKVSLRNMGQEPQEAIRLLTPDMGFVSFEVSLPGKPPRPYVSCGEALLAGEPVPVQIRPGGSYSATVDLTHEPGREEPRKLEPLLSRPGGYSIQATYRDSRVELTSNSLTITVVEPEGVDLAAFGVLQSNPLSQQYGPWSAVGRNSFHDIVTGFPESRYAAYSAFSLGIERHVHASRDLVLGTKESKEAADAAAQLFLLAARSMPGTPMSLLALRRAGVDYATAGKMDIGGQLLQEALSHPAATDEDRVQALSWLQLLQEGYWQTGRREAQTEAKIRIPIRPFAKALGLFVSWDQKSGKATIRNRGTEMILLPKEDCVILNGMVTSSVPMSLDEGQTKVPPQIMASLMADYYGAGMRDALSRLLALLPAAGSSE